MGAISTRLATPADAFDAVNVLRKSITLLCEMDHRNDGATLERWLRNKTPEHFNVWCADLDNRLVVGAIDSALVGVAALHRGGEIRLCYVSPESARVGVGRALLLALEAHARDWSIATLTLNSTLTARHFYERCGFSIAGDPTPGFGILRSFPYAKTL
jgi:GNAT superfamily N-acetyltransferase